jgi:hypothetical protein
MACEMNHCAPAAALAAISLCSFLRFRWRSAMVTPPNTCHNATDADPLSIRA